MLNLDFGNKFFEKYRNYLQAICSFSKLYSESNIPFLYYRTAENIFCKAFEAENLSRADLAYDAKIENIGYGLKTFVEKGKNLEKIAEFNLKSNELRNTNPKNLAIKLAELRNERIDFANRIYNIETAFYHCVARKDFQIMLYETDYKKIEVNEIKNIKITKSSFSFEESDNYYSFNFSKSTLYKRFVTPNNAKMIDIQIFDEPFDIILKLFQANKKNLEINNEVIYDFVILPLYSLRESTEFQKKVSEKSGLNQWNAGGRKRDYGEVYIPVPKIIHKLFPKFFPEREDSFELILPNGETLSAKLCQENSKALMTNPNNALSDWLLRKVLLLKEGELLTYERLAKFNVDSVKISKIDNNRFFIDFSKLNSFEEFIENNRYKLN